jgi:hypothetical protein
MATEDVQRAVQTYLSGAVSADTVTAYVAQIPQQYPGWTAQLESDWPVPGDWTLRLASPLGPAQEYWLHAEEAQVYLMTTEPAPGPERTAARGTVVECQPWQALRGCLEVLAIAGEEWIGEPELMTVCALALEDAGGRVDEQRGQELCSRVIAAYRCTGRAVATNRYAVETLRAVVDTRLAEAGGP